MSDLEQYTKAIADSIAGKVHYSRTILLSPPNCHVKIVGAIASVRCTIFLGDDGGIVTLDRFSAPCAFQMALFKPLLELGLTTDIGQAVDAPYPVFSTTRDMYTTCIRRLFVWSHWRVVLEPFKTAEAPLFICSAQCEIRVGRAFLCALAEIIPPLALKFAETPFGCIGKDEPERYGKRTYVTIRVEDVPETLRPLVPLAIEWSVEQESEILEFARKQGKRRVEHFVRAFQANMRDIEAFCPVDAKRRPVTEAVNVFASAFHAFAVVTAEIREQFPN